jgi:hypothetical protein
VTWQQKKSGATHGKNFGEKWPSKSPQNNAPKLTDFKEQFLKSPYLDNSFQQIAKIYKKKLLSSLTCSQIWLFPLV